MKIFYPMNERGPGGPRYRRPGGRRYISNQEALHFQKEHFHLAKELASSL